MVYPPTGLTAYEREMNTLPILLQVYGTSLPLPFSKILCFMSSLFYDIVAEHLLIQCDCPPNLALHVATVPCKASNTSLTCSACDWRRGDCGTEAAEDGEGKRRISNHVAA